MQIHITNQKPQSPSYIIKFFDKEIHITTRSNYWIGIVFGKNGVEYETTGVHMVEVRMKCFDEILWRRHEERRANDPSLSEPGVDGSKESK
jgi:hypothetical protein